MGQAIKAVSGNVDDTAEIAEDPLAEV